MASRAALAAASLALAAAFACLHFEPVPLAPRGAPAALAAAVKPGDTVEVVDRGQRTRRFRVTALSDQAIEGAGVRVPLNEVESVKVRRFGLDAPGQGRGGSLSVLGALLGAAAGVAILVAVL